MASLQFTETLERARIVAASICEADGCSADYCRFMRDGSYDHEREVRIAHAALLARNVKDAPVLAVAA